MNSIHPVAAHFQLTGRCNLHCRFCGQSKGMLAAGTDELPFELWLRAAAELKHAAEATGRTPRITLWGGEPLLHADFDRLAATLHQDGFRLDAVTNGTLIDRHAATLNTRFETVFVSIDGFGEAHDAVRGAGVFGQVRRNLGLLKKRRGKLVFLTTVSDANVAGISQLPHRLAELGPDAIVLQQLMYLSGAEISAYREYSRAEFGCDYPELTAWRRDDDREYLDRLRRELEAVAREHYTVPVHFTAHRCPDGGETPPCEAPGCRVHIRHDGETGFCTDYFGFSAGNIRLDTLENIFHGERAAKFRAAVAAGKLPVCNHCPWRGQHLGQA